MGRSSLSNPYERVMKTNGLVYHSEKAVPKMEAQPGVCIESVLDLRFNTSICSCSLFTILSW